MLTSINGDLKGISWEIMQIKISGTPTKIKADIHPFLGAQKQLVSTLYGLFSEVEERISYITLPFCQGASRTLVFQDNMLDPVIAP